MCSPYLDGQGNRFVPSPELARTHIVNSITILLQQSPVQGKSALEDIVALVSSKFFPNTPDKAITALKETGLARPRKSLLRNVVIVFLKEYLLSTSAKSHQFSTAIRAVLSMHRKEVLVILESETSRVVRSMNDDKLSSAILLISSINEISDFIDTDQLDRLKRFVSTLSGDDLMYIDSALEIQQIQSTAISRVNRLSLEEIQAAIFFGLPSQVGDRLIRLLSDAESFGEANQLCNEIRKSLRDFSSSQLKAIVAVGNNNEQVQYAFDYKNLCNEIETQLDTSG